MCAERLKRVATQGLLAFVLVSVGFSLGRHAAVREAAPDDAARGTGRQVFVYYLHSTFRCNTCNTIEAMTAELLEQTYSEELATGRIRWISTDFQQNEALARRFEVAASCVVVAETSNGNLVDYQPLDQVWTLLDDETAFRQYVGGAIDATLERIGGDS